MGSFIRRSVRLLPAAVLVCHLAVAAADETPEHFVQRLGKTKGASAVVNMREDKSLGAIAIALTPQLVADRAQFDPLLVQVGEFASGRQLRATVVTPNPADGEFVVSRLKAAGVTRVKVQPMADFVSIKTSRIFLVPGP